MKLPVVLTPESIQDMEDILFYLSGRSPDAAMKFPPCADETFQRLSEMPELGETFSTRKRSLKNVRIWAVKDFPNHLIFYRMDTDKIVILRLRHGSTNYAVE